MAYRWSEVELSEMFYTALVADPRSEGMEAQEVRRLARHAAAGAMRMRPRTQELVPALKPTVLSLVEEVQRLRALEVTHLALLDTVAGPPGSTCTQQEAMSDVEWTRRHWRSALDNWKWWKRLYEEAHGEQPASLTIKARNLEAQRDALAAKAEAGKGLYEALRAHGPWKCEQCAAALARWEAVENG